MWGRSMETGWDSWGGSRAAKDEGGLNFDLAPFTPFGHQMQNEGCHLDSLKPKAVPWSETSIPAVS